MLQKMRERTQGIIAGGIVALICVTFALWGIQNYTKSTGNTEEVAKVNGVVITPQQLQLAYEKARQQELARGNVTLDQNSQAALKKQVLQQLIEDTLLTQALIKLGFNIGAEQLNAIIFSMPIFQENGHFSVDKMRQLLSNLSYSEKEFAAELQHSMMLSQFEAGVVASSFILPSEIKTANKFLDQKRDFAYFIISPERFAKEVSPSDSEINQYYEQHANEFVIPEKISIEYIELKAADLKKEIKNDSQRLDKFYNDNIDTYSSPKRWQIQRILLPATDDSQKKLLDIAQQIQAGKNFTDFSPPAATWVDRNNGTADFIEQLNKLAPNQVSSIFKTNEGLNLVKVLAVQPSKVLPLTSIRDRVQQNFEKQQLTQLFSERNDKLADLTYTNSDNLTTAAQTLGLTVNTSGLFTRDGEKTGLAANPKIIKVAFSEAVLKQNYNSSPIEITAGDVVVLRIKNHIAESVRPLAEVRTQVVAQVKAQKMQSKARDLGVTIVKALNDGKIEKVNQQYNLVWRTLSRVGREDKQVSANILTAAFSLPPAVDGKVAVSGIDLVKGGYALVKLNAVYDGDENISSERMKALNHDLPIGFGQFDYYLWVNELRNKAKIKINESSAADST